MTWYITYHAHYMGGDKGDIEVEAEQRAEIETPLALANAIYSTGYNVLEIGTIPLERSTGNVKVTRASVLSQWPPENIAAMVNDLTKEGLALCIDGGKKLEITPVSQRQDNAA